MKSYIKIYGPPILEAIKTLEKIAIDMPEVCIMDTAIQLGFSVGHLYEDTSYAQSISQAQNVQNFFTERGIGPVSPERCGKIVSKSGESVGEYDFYFEWFDSKDLSPAKLDDLIKKIDAALAPLGCRYTITTK